MKVGNEIGHLGIAEMEVDFNKARILRRRVRIVVEGILAAGGFAAVVVLFFTCVAIFT